MNPLAKNNRKNQVLAVGLAIILGVTIFATLVAGNVLVLSTAPATGVRPLTLSGITFKVYDGRYANPTSNAPIGSVGSGQSFTSGGNTFPDVDCFNSQPFFVSPTGATVAQPYVETQYTVIGQPGQKYATEYIATGVYYGFDIGSRTHAHLGAISGITMTGATLSPWAEYTWASVGASQLGWPYTDGETIHISDHPGAFGSLVFSCNDDFLGDEDEFGNEIQYHYTWGTDHGQAAAITQSLSPFFYEWAATMNTNYPSHPTASDGLATNLDYRFFNDNRGWGYGFGIWSSQQRQLEYVMNNYKVAPVVVVPTVTAAIQDSVIWAPYSKQVTLSTGALAQIDVAYSTVRSGIRSAFVSPNQDYNQAGKITTNTYQAIKGKSVLPTGDIVELPPTTGQPNANSFTIDFTGITTAKAISGSLNFNGDLRDVDPGKNAQFEPAINGIYTMNPDVIGIQQGRYPFSVADRTSVNGLQPSAVLSSKFTMQPATDIKWADVKMTVQDYQWRDASLGESGFTNNPGQRFVHIYYPYGISVNNVYTIQRWIVEVWTLSTYKVTITANGAPINGTALSDAEMTSLVNNPAMDNVYQWVAVPVKIDWLTILLVVLIGIAALVIFGVIMNAWASRTSVKVSIVDRGGRNVQARQQQIITQQPTVKPPPTVSAKKPIQLSAQKSSEIKSRRIGGASVSSRVKKWFGEKI